MACTHVDRWLRCKKRGSYFLTPDDVHAMRALFSEGWFRYQLAKSWGISFRTATRVVRHEGRYAKPLSELGDGFNRVYHPPKSTSFQ